METSICRCFVHIRGPLNSHQKKYPTSNIPKEKSFLVFNVHLMDVSFTGIFFTKISPWNFRPVPESSSKQFRGETRGPWLRPPRRPAPSLGARRSKVSLGKVPGWWVDSFFLRGPKPGCSLYSNRAYISIYIYIPWKSKTIERIVPWNCWL